MDEAGRVVWRRQAVTVVEIPDGAGYRVDCEWASFCGEGLCVHRSLHDAQVWAQDYWR
jgi:hypothetical protein